MAFNKVNWESQWLQLQAQWQANARLRWMVWCIGYIVLFYFALLLQQTSQEIQDKLAKLERDSATMTALQTQTEWPARLLVEQTIYTKLRGRLWAAANTGLAEADFQSYLKHTLEQNGAQQVRIKMAPTRTAQGMWQVQVEVNAVLDNQSIEELMAALAAHDKYINVERFNYSPQRGGQTALLVSAYFVSVPL